MSSSLITLIYRTVGAWGTGKGSNLTPAEVDDNFYQVQQALHDLAENPALPPMIESITVLGNQMTFHMDDGLTTFGPFTLPTATFKFTGAWKPGFAYKEANLFTVHDGLYYVNRDHVSSGSFVAGEGAGVGGVLPYASLVMPFPIAIDISFFWPGFPGLGIVAAESDSSDSSGALPAHDGTMLGYLTTRDFFLPASLLNSSAVLEVPATGTLTFRVLKNDDDIGTITFDPGESEAVLSFGADVAFSAAAKDKLRILRPLTVDGTARNLYVALKGVLGAPDAESSS